MRRALLLLAVLASPLCLSGCVERFLTIHSDPPGAAVYVDGEKVGTTPCEVTYAWYGTRDLILDLKGYTLVRQQITLSPPWWQILPFDFITDIIIPISIHDRTIVSYALDEAPISQEAVDGVLERAEELRKKANPPKE